jgi:hypothetical protein
MIILKVTSILKESSNKMTFHATNFFQLDKMWVGIF